MNKEYIGKMLLLGFVVFLSLSACDNSVQPTVQVYRLSYDGNGNDGGTSPAAIQGSPGSQVSAAVNSGYLTKEGYYFAGWNTRSDSQGASYKPGKPVTLDSPNLVLYAHWLLEPPEIKKFYAVTTDETWYQVEAVNLAENDACVVYGDINEGIAPEVAEHIAAEYKNQIHSQITGAFGGINYMSNNDGKLFLLLLDIQDGFTGSGGYVAGYFDSTHMWAKNSNSRSNEAAMLFMDVYPGDPANIKSFCTVIAHELQHLINFSNPNRKQPQNTWINEGLSLAAEYIYGGEQIEQRINYFNAKGTTIPYGNNFFVWDGYWEQTYGDVLANYATAYLFFRWLGIQAGGSGIYRDIGDSAYTDYRAVTTAAINLASDWETLLGTWMLANYYQAGTGVYGYNNGLRDGQKSVSLTKHTLPVDVSSYPLFSGEGVFSVIPGDEVSSTPAGTYIRYIGLPASPPPLLFQDAPYSGKILLTFNGNTDITGKYAEYGYVASLAPGSAGAGKNAVGRNSLGPVRPPEGTYPVDFREMAKKNRTGSFAP